MRVPATQDIDLTDVVGARVLAGDPIYFVGPMSGEAFALHAGLVDRLGLEVGRSVTVVYGQVSKNRRGYER